MNPIRDTLKEPQADFVRQVLADAQFEEILDALEKADLHVAPLKGILFRRWLYANPTERPLSDLDLLVPPEMEEPISAQLVGLGYTPMDSLMARFRFGAIKEKIFLREGGLPVELHRSPASGRGAKRLSARIFQDGLRGSAPLFRDGALIAPAEHHLLSLAFHFREHWLCFRACQLDDARRLIRLPGFDVGKLETLAKDCDALLPLSLLFYAAEIDKTFTLPAELAFRKRLLTRRLCISEQGCWLDLPGFQAYGLSQGWRLALHTLILRDSLSESTSSQVEHGLYYLKTLADFVRKS